MRDHLLVRGLLIAGLAAGVVACSKPEPEPTPKPDPAPAPAPAPERVTLDLEGYAKACDSELAGGAPIQWPETLHCEAGAVLDIELKGTVIPAQNDEDRKNFTKTTNCDKPPLLDISRGGIGQCVPNSRLQVNRVAQQGVADGDRPYMALLCRNYKYRSLDAQKLDPQYDDVAMVVYSPKNNKTCFFQRLSNTALQALPADAASFEPLESIPGANIPSPFGPNGKNFWDYKAAKRINCASCHDANPFVRTPYVHQVTVKSSNSLPPRKFAQAYGIVKIDDFGPDWKAFNAYFNVVEHKKGTAGACFACHSLGPGNSSGSFTRYSAGELAPNQADSDNFRLTHWMPPAADEKSWKADYGEALKLLATCSAKPTAPECGRTSLY